MIDERALLDGEVQIQDANSAGNGAIFDKRIMSTPEQAVPTSCQSEIPRSKRMHHACHYHESSATGQRSSPVISCKADDKPGI